MRLPLKVAVIFNEANPELYQKTKNKLKKLDFTPYFEVQDFTPVEEYQIITEALRKEGVDAYALNILDDIHLLMKDLKKKKPDVIFNFIELYEEDARLEMNIVGLLELLRIPYTGAPPLAMANCQNKVLAKRLLNNSGILTPDYFLIKKLSNTYPHKLNYPLIVKPAFEDASVGIDNNSIVRNSKSLKERIEYIFVQFSQPVLVEEFIEGRELNIAILGDKDPEVLPISEIDFTNMPDHLHNIVSYQAKWDPNHESYHKTIPICPANLAKETEEKTKQIALNAFKTMGCRDYARVDMRLTNENELYVLEVNPNPDLTEGAGFMRSAETAGYNYAQTLIKIIEFAYERRKG